MTDLAHRLRYLAACGTDTDTDLLARFVAERDGLAFAALVARHGPMVLAVCRRVLRHRQDAEDAFQAAFLVLARRAAALPPGVPLGGWLHGVAYRTALAARRAARTRRAREAKAARVGEAAPEETGASVELREALDRELAALPEMYRAALVACELEGLIPNLVDELSSECDRPVEADSPFNEFGMVGQPPAPLDQRFLQRRQGGERLVRQSLSDQGPQRLDRLQLRRARR